VDVKFGIVDVDYECLIVRLYKLDVNYHPLVVRLLSLAVDYHYVDIDIHRPLPNVPYIRTIRHTIDEPFIHSKPSYANHILCIPTVSLPPS
jgi:hypothetical protein